jgi:hypothetical protein
MDMLRVVVGRSVRLREVTSEASFQHKEGNISSPDMFLV